MATTFEMNRQQDAPAVAAALLHAFLQRRVFTFTGPLGVGKTTLIKALCRALGVTDGMASPSFSIVNEYRTAQGGTVYHFDLYRLNKAGELDGIGFTEYLDSGHYCFVEWPAIGNGLYPPDTVHVHMAMDAEEKRTLTIHPSTTLAEHHA